MAGEKPRLAWNYECDRHWEADVIGPYDGPSRSPYAISVLGPGLSPSALHHADYARTALAEIEGRGSGEESSDGK